MRFIYIVSVLLFIGGCSSTQHIKIKKERNSTPVKKIYIKRASPTISPTPTISPPPTPSPTASATPRVDIATPTPIIVKEEIVEDKKRVIVKKHQNIKLKKVMNNLDYILFSRINLEVKEGEDDLFFTKNGKKTLKKFVEDAKKVKLLYPNADDEYIRLSKALIKASTKLYKIVEAKKMEWVKPQVDNIINICNSCHDIYAF